MSLLEVLAVVAIGVYIIQSHRLISAMFGLRESIDALRIPDMDTPRHHIMDTLDHSGSQYVIWMWMNGRWQLDEGSVPEGAEPGTPPQAPGVYEGECVKCAV